MQRNTADESPNLTPAAVAAWLQTHAAHDAEVEAEVAQMTDGVVVTPTSSPRGWTATSPEVRSG